VNSLTTCGLFIVTIATVATASRERELFESLEKREQLATVVHLQRE
jgi:hypothetical protein